MDRLRPAPPARTSDRSLPVRESRHPAILLALVISLTVSACQGSSSSSFSSAGRSRAISPGSGSLAFSGGSSGTQGKFLVVAGENFWGSIATQLAGGKAQVRSIIVNPETDPHSYTSTASDGRLIAQSAIAIVNGVGYDNWASQSLAASPSSSRVVVNVGDLLALKQGENPHRWYFPASVYAVVNQIVADYDKLDPADAAYFARQKQSFETRGLARYNQLRQEIRAKYAGVPVGYSESIFQGLGQDLGLKLLTPYRFTKAIAEGTDVTAADKQTVERQAQSRQIKVWVYNRQNITPDVQRVTSAANARHIPSATITETLSPASDSFEQWQVAQLRVLRSALHRATGR
ncbi:MAG: metal ABC transporter solute-binding protein, Zn/Mn family [Solirubrobacteraceae bacterium]